MTGELEERLAATKKLLDEFDTQFKSFHFFDIINFRPDVSTRYLSLSMEVVELRLRAKKESLETKSKEGPAIFFESRISPVWKLKNPSFECYYFVSLVGAGAAVVATTQVAMDHNETQPVDIETAPSPVAPPPPILSPQTTAAEKRQKYTGIGDAGLPSTATGMDRPEGPPDGSAAPDQEQEKERGFPKVGSGHDCVSNGSYRP